MSKMDQSFQSPLGLLLLVELIELIMAGRVKVAMGSCLCPTVLQIEMTEGYNVSSELHEIHLIYMYATL